MLIRAQRSAAIVARPPGSEKQTFWRSDRRHPPELRQGVPEVRSMPAYQQAGMASAPLPMSGAMPARGPSTAAADRSALRDAGFDGDAGRVFLCGTADGGQAAKDRRP
jgi:hypothetical protein